MEIPKSILPLTLTKMKPENKGITFYMDMVRQYDWDKDEMEELTGFTVAFAEFMKHEEMLDTLKAYEVD